MKPTRETEDTLEWSRSCRDWQTATDTPRRLHVSINDDSTMIDVVECDVTSHSDTAQRLRPGEDTRGMVFNQAEARWLLEALAAALNNRPAKWDEPETEQARAASEAARDAIDKMFEKGTP